MSSSGTILVLGATGKVGAPICRLLQAADIPFLAASRSGKAPHGVVFDWFDESTYTQPFSTAKPPISAVYIIGPLALDASPLAISFIDLARSKGVRRFVLQSGSPVEEGQAGLGKIHAYLKQLGDKGEAEWAVLRPTWFSQNFSQQEHHRSSIRSDGRIVSATGTGKIPWISVDDIAAAAVAVLTGPEAPNRDFVLTGPELLSYDDIAAVLTEILGKKVVHVNLAREDLEAGYRAAGLPEDYAAFMGVMDTDIKHGSEDRMTDAVLALTGKEPRKFREVAEAEKAAWA